MRAGIGTNGSADGTRVVFAGGGTGGHLYPAIAVARALQRRYAPATVSFVGTARGLEMRLVPREGFELDVIRSAGLKGKSLRARARGVRLLPLSALDAWRVLTRRQPHVVVGVGGYSSGPVVAIAALRGIPTLVLEQNATPGITNRLLAWIVDEAAVTYDVTLAHFGSKGFVSGNPVRAEFFARRSSRAPHGGPLALLVFGGSQGAAAINAAMTDAAPALARAGGFHVVHQTGESDLARVRAAYAAAGQEADVRPFIDDMAQAMADADVIVCRAGATTLAELAAVGRPAILIPLPTATDDHQRVNARALAQAGAAELLEEGEAAGGALGARILALAGDADRRRHMSEALRRLARPEAADLIADRVHALAQRAGAVERTK